MITQQMCDSYPYFKRQYFEKTDDIINQIIYNFTIFTKYNL